jgi:hypothetical protein
MTYPYQIKYQRPKLYWLVKLLFPDYDFARHYLTFYRTIYVSRGINEVALAHELVHVQQQGSSRINAIMYVIKYWLDAKFRYQSELAGYRAEYQAFKHKTNDFGRVADYAAYLAKCLMQPVYGFGNSEENFYKILNDLRA